MLLAVWFQKDSPMPRPTVLGSRMVRMNDQADNCTEAPPKRNMWIYAVVHQYINMMWYPVIQGTTCNQLGIYFQFCQVFVVWMFWCFACSAAASLPLPCLSQFFGPGHIRYRRDKDDKRSNMGQCYDLTTLRFQNVNLQISVWRHVK